MGYCKLPFRKDRGNRGSRKDLNTRDEKVVHQSLMCEKDNMVQNSTLLSVLPLVVPNRTERHRSRGDTNLLIREGNPNTKNDEG